jgi:hypothetical protein
VRPEKLKRGRACHYSDAGCQRRVSAVEMRLVRGKYGEVNIRLSRSDRNLRWGSINRHKRRGEISLEYELWTMKSHMFTMSEDLLTESRDGPKSSV